MDDRSDRLAEKLIDISNRAKRRDRRLKRGSGGEGFGLIAGRVHDLESLFAARHGNELSHDDAGLEDFEILVVPIRGLRGDGSRHLERYRARWCPWMTDAELEELNRRTERDLPLSAVELGKLMRLTAAERLELGITTIRPFDRTAEQLERERCDRWNAKKRAKHKRSHADIQAEAAAKVETQKALGVSRATFYRMRAKMA
jgi:hypothetical protein